jgi:hypothetical protein
MTTLTPDDNLRYANSADMRARTAAYPREGRARLRLRGAGFVLYYQQVFSPVGLAAEEMPKRAARTRESMAKFVERLGQGMGLDLTVSGEGHYVLLGVEDKSISFNVEASVIATDPTSGRPKKLAGEDILAQEQAVFDRFGYQVEIL